MAKSLKALLGLTQRVTEEEGITTEGLVGISVMRHGVTIQMRPLELARLSQKLAIPRSRIKFSEVGDSIHIQFWSRGIDWVTVVDQHGLDTIQYQLGDGPSRRIVCKPKSLTQVSPALTLTSRSAE